MAEPSNKSIIDKFLDEYLVEGVPSPGVVGTTLDQMQKLTGKEAGALYDSWMKDIYVPMNFNPYSEFKGKGETPRQSGQHELLHFLDDLYAPDINPQEVSRGTSPAQWGTDELNNQLNWANINKMIGSMPFRQAQDLANTVTTDSGRNQEILTYMLDSGTKGFATGTGALTNTVHNILKSKEPQFDIKNIVSFMGDREKVFDMFDKVTENKMTEEGKGHFRSRKDIKVQDKWGSSVIN